MKMKSIVAVLSLAVLAACAGDRTAQVQPQGGTEFTRALSREYADYAQIQRTQAFDWGSAAYFDRKAGAVARGEALAPETPGQGWRVVVNPMRDDLTRARERLVTALQNNATTRAPAAAARAQARYDCWLENNDDPIFATRGEWLNRKVEICRSEFESAMAEVDAAMRPPPAPAAAPPPPAPAQPPREQSFLVFFEFDRWQVTPQGGDVIRRAVETWRRGGSPRIVVTGHADRAGPDAYNQRLSERRAAAVRDALTGQGVPAGQITTQARGETQPLVPTPDGVREPQNRRVEIVLQ